MKQSNIVPTDATNTRSIALENHTKKLEKIIYRKDTLIALDRRRLREIVETLMDALMNNGDIYIDSIYVYLNGCEYFIVVTILDSEKF